ncbi:MAG: recombinase family protein [Bryobacteraceae bacterium]
MTGQRIGYIRVSDPGQNTARQERKLKPQWDEHQLDGQTLDRIFTDKVSGKNVDRPQLTAALSYVRDGDTLVICSMDRLARNLLDLLTIVRDLTGRGVKVEFLKERLTFGGEDDAMNQLLLGIMGAFAQFERSLIHERQLEGIAIARENGVYLGRKPKLDAAGIAELKRRVATGEQKARIAEDMKISRETLYKYLRA